MKRKLVAIMIITFINLGLLAQENDLKNDTTRLEEIVITGSKVPTPQRQTAKPVQIITREQIEKNSGKSLAQLLNDQSGLTINGAYSNPGKDNGVYIRGASNEYTLILVDGNPVNDPSGIGGAFDIRLFSLSQIDRIEILKGSQSTLYGTDAIAGVINIITLKSSEKPINLNLLTSYGSLNTIDAAVGINGTIEKKFEYNINFERKSSDGFSEAKNLSDTLDFDKDGYKQTSVQTYVKYKIGKSIEIKPFINYTEFNSDYDADAFTDAPNTYKSKFINSGAQAQFQSKKLIGNLSYNYVLMDRKYLTTYGQYNYDGRFNNMDAFFVYKLKEHIQLLGGANFQNLKMIDSTTTTKNPSVTISSPYISLLLKDIEGLNIELGYRLNLHSKYGYNSSYSIAPAYYITNNIKVFTSYSTGFKAPTLLQLYGPFGANEKLKPQHSVSTEIGFQSDLFERKVSTQFTYYWRTIEDIINYSYSNGYFNQDMQKDQGLEINETVKISNKINFQATYNYVTGKVTTKDENGQDKSFYNLIKRPKNHFSFLFQFNLTNNLFASLNLQYSGNRTDYYFNPVNNYQIEEVGLDPYFLLNAYAEYKLLNHRVLVFLDLKNITNEKFTETYGYNTIGFNITTGLRFQLFQ
jgi:vitamin B12 transporter